MARQKLSHIFTKIAFKALRTNLFNIVLLAFFLTIGSAKIYSQEINNKSTAIPINKQADSIKIVTTNSIIADTINADTIKKKPILEGKIKYKEHIVEGIEKFPQTLRMLFTGKNYGKLLLKI